MNILGINSVYHDSAAAIVVDGHLVAAAEEERFNRRKHGKSARVDNSDHLPENAIRFCLEQAGLRAKDIHAIAFSFSPSLRRQKFSFDSLSRAGDWGSREGEAVFLEHLNTIPSAIQRLFDCVVGPEKLHWVPHHLAHAASAYHASGWNEAAIMVIDGIGEADTGLTAVGCDGRIEQQDRLIFPHSIGFVWEKLCQFLGFSEYDACKVMGMSAYGDPAPYRDTFAQFMGIDAEGGFTCHAPTLCFRLDDMGPLESFLGSARQSGELINQRHYDIAAALQEVTNRAILSIAKRLRDKSSQSSLCYAGGVALNCTTNKLLLDSGLFERIYVPSAPHDAGTAIGAALYVASGQGEGLSVASVSPYLGPSFDATTIEKALKRAGLVWQRVDDIDVQVAKLLVDGEIVGWFQGRMEFGPRALGNRSLLADPRRADSRGRMNALVKRRESFRPFAPSVLSEYADSWFDIGRPSILHDLMLVTCLAHQSRRDQIPAALHVDGSARVQLVRRNSNPHYHALLSRFYEMTGVPVLLNTSFNDSEPIVCTPDDAVRTFMNSPINALAIGDYLVTATKQEALR